jgi:fermentation-respiration switch protein FrsA (DUF1100 family)
MMEVKCSVFIVHGKKDSLISFDHSKELISKYKNNSENCYSRKFLLTP